MRTLQNGRGGFRHPAMRDGQFNFPKKCGGLPTRPTINMMLLALETSCDETSAAVVRDGGFCPAPSPRKSSCTPNTRRRAELAAREHLRNLMPSCNRAARSDVQSGQLDAVAARRDRFAMALLVGFKAAQPSVHVAETIRRHQPSRGASVFAVDCF